MANRFPLIFDANDGNKIKELPNGDNLNLLGSSIIDVVNILSSGTITVDSVVTTNLTVGNNPIAEVAKTNNYNDLSNLPTLFSGDYNDLDNKPPAFTGNYNDLSNKPTIPTLTSQLINDAGFITNNNAAITATEIVGLSDVAISNSYTDLDDKPDLSLYVTQSQIVGGTLTIDVNNTGALQGDVVDSNGNTLIDHTEPSLTIPVINGTATAGLAIDGNDQDITITTAGVVEITADAILLNGDVGATIKGSLDGDLRGSVFADDSSLIVDGINRRLVGTVDGDIAKGGVNPLNISATNNIVVTSGNGYQLLANGTYVANTTDYTVNSSSNVNINSTTTLELSSSNQYIKLSTAVPFNSFGNPGDKAGMIAVDGDYLYLCTADYVDTDTDIWTRQKLAEVGPWQGNTFSDSLILALEYIPERVDQTTPPFDADPNGGLVFLGSTFSQVDTQIDCNDIFIGYNRASLGTATRSIYIGSSATGLGGVSENNDVTINGRLILDVGNVPTTARGSAGDREGMVAFDGNYVYRCNTDFTDGSTPIWVRTAWGDTSDWS